MKKERPEKLYKDKYVIMFYEKDDDTFKYQFNNLRQVCKELGWPITRNNMNRIQVDIYRSIRKHNHQTNLFKGQCLKVYIVDVVDEDDEND